MSGKDVRVVRIWTDYLQRGGKTVAIDKVEFCAVGNAQKSTTIVPMSHLARCRPPTGPDDIAALMANDIYNQIKPFYDAFKKGSEIPESGTPLGAWPGISPEQATVLRTNGFRTVEEIADASDGVMMRIQLPNPRGLIEQAQRFLAAHDKARIASDLESKDAEIARLREEQEDMKRILLEMQEAQDKPKRGRPKHTDDQQAVA